MAYDKDETFKRIFKGIAEDCESLRSVLMRHDMPAMSTFMDWVANDKEKAEQYARAMEIRADKIFEEILDIADDSSGDTIITEEGKEVFNNEFAARSRVRIDARKWMLAKMQPKKYGNSIDVTSGGEKIQQPIISLDPLNDKTDNGITEDSES